MNGNFRQKINRYKVIRVLLFLLFAVAYYISLIILKELSVKLIVFAIGFVSLFACKFVIDFLEKKR